MNDKAVTIGGSPELGTYEMIQRMANDIELLKKRIAGIDTGGDDDSGVIVNPDEEDDDGLIPVLAIGRGTDVTNYGNGLSAHYWNPNTLGLQVSGSGRYKMTDYIPVSVDDYICYTGDRTPGDPNDLSIGPIPFVVGYSDENGSDPVELLGNNRFDRNFHFINPDSPFLVAMGCIRIKDENVHYVRCAGKEKGYLNSKADMRVIKILKQNVSANLWYVHQAIAEAQSQNYAQYPLKPVDLLPTANEDNMNKAFVLTNASDNTKSDMWLVKKTGEGSGVTYSWSKVGTIGADLSNYYTKSEVDRANNSKYTMPGSGIPKSDMASAVQTSLEKADTAYQKSAEGIPSTDLDESVQTSLNKAETAYQKPGDGIPGSDLDETTRESLNKADEALRPLTDEELEELLPLD